MFLRSLTLSLLLLPGLSLAQDKPIKVPVDSASAVIDGPAKIAPGDLLILSAEKSVGKSYAWVVLPEKTFLAVEDGKKLVFASGTAGEYVFVLAVGDADGSVSIGKHTVVIGNPTPPTPPVPPPAPDRFGLTLISRTAAAAINRPDEGRKLAAAQRGVASAVAAGGLATPQAILQAWREANNQTVQSSVWRTWGEAAGNALSKLYADKRIVSKDDWVIAFNELAAGLD